jgi:hypothetical protein
MPIFLHRIDGGCDPARRIRTPIHDPSSIQALWGNGFFAPPPVILSQAGAEKVVFSYHFANISNIG